MVCDFSNEYRMQVGPIPHMLALILDLLSFVRFCHLSPSSVSVCYLFSPWHNTQSVTGLVLHLVKDGVSEMPA